MIGLDIPGLRLTKVDSEGVPLLVQRLVHDEGAHQYRIELFDGSVIELAEEDAIYLCGYHEDHEGHRYALLGHWSATDLVERWLKEKTIYLPGAGFDRFLHGLLYPNCR